MQNIISRNKNQRLSMIQRHFVCLFSFLSFFLCFILGKMSFSSFNYLLLYFKSAAFAALLSLRFMLVLTVIPVSDPNVSLLFFPRYQSSL